MNTLSPNLAEDSDEEYFLDEDDIVHGYDIDEEELPDADEEGDSDGEAGSSGERSFDGVDDSVHIFKGHTGELYTVACSPTNPMLVASGGEDDKAFLWRIGQENCDFELQGHQNSVSSLSFSADGHILASGGVDGVVKLWDVANGNLICTLEGPGGTSEVEWVKWHPRGHVVLAGFDNSSIFMWNADKAAYMNSFPGHAGSITCGNFTPDGRKICSCSQDGTMRIFNPVSAQVLHVVQGHTYHSEEVTCLTISFDSSLALTGSKDGSLRVVNIETGQVVSSLNGHSGSVACAAFEPCSRRDQWRAATGALDNKLIIWDQDSTPRWVCEHEDEVLCLLWLSGARYIATGCGDGSVRIWDSLSGVSAKIFHGHTDEIQSMAASVDGKFLTSVSYDKTARVFDIAEFR